MHSRSVSAHADERCRQSLWPHHFASRGLVSGPKQTGLYQDTQNVTLRIVCEVDPREAGLESRNRTSHIYIYIYIYIYKHVKM